MTVNALYYPYIHLHDVDWLKKTLLFFNQVRRMTPVIGVQPNDSAEVLPFTQEHGGRSPLLISAQLSLPRAVRAQADLAQRILKDVRNNTEFVKRFDCDAAVAGGAPAFQIHQGKLDQRLKDALGNNGLAWNPRQREPYDKYGDYIQVHPAMGEAVMATIAIACAKGEGLDIVGDGRSGPLHDCLTGKQEKEVYDALIHPADRGDDPQKPDAKELFDFLVYFACDVTKVAPESLASLDREPIHKLMCALAKRAEHISESDPGKDRETQFRDEVSKVMGDWRMDKANMMNFWKKVFGAGLVEEGGKFLQKFVEVAAKAVPPTAASAGTGALAGLALHQPLIVATAAGFGIGLLSHGAKTYTKLIETDRQSSYRYLSLMETAGVIFRTDLRPIPSAAGGDL
jgi:hypothetical protein